MFRSMYRGLRVAVVIPAFNEVGAVATTVTSVPDFVDHVIVVDDGSHDETARVAASADRGQVEIVCHGANRGVGAAIVTGYRRALDLGVDAAAVMAGDGQMDPSDLPSLLDPLADHEADYTKGNRFRSRAVWREMPPARLAGNIALSCLTKVTSGYWHLFDSQCGYTAASRRALLAVELEKMFPRYGYPNDLLARLHSAGLRVVDVPVQPIYGETWRSGISVGTVIYPISFVLLRSWAQRLTNSWRESA